MADSEPEENLRRHVFGVVPVFLVDDLLETVEYYREVLGFETNFLYGEPPFYASVARDDAVINFAVSNPPGRRNSVGGQGDGNGTDGYLVVSDIDDIYAELQGKGATVIAEIDSYDYGMREFQIEDCNGYRLIFGSETEEA